MARPIPDKTETSDTPAGTGPLDLPVETLRGVGSRHAENLRRLDITRVRDFLEHYPIRYVDRREIVPMGELPIRLAMPEERPVATVLGTVVGARVAGKPARFRRGFAAQRLEVTLRDDSGSAAVVFFGGGWRRDHFKDGAVILASGPLGAFRGRPQFQNPDYEILDHEEQAAFHTGRLFPVYPLTRGLTQRQLRGWAAAALSQHVKHGCETLPQELRTRYKLAPLHAAYSGIHFPRSGEERREAVRRLAFDELFFDQLFMGAIRRRREHGRLGRPCATDGPLLRRIRAGLPFTLTGDQQGALGEILGDLASGPPMNRLLQGDVGSGKTVVALLAAAAAADSGVQTAFMAPTEILAEQHFRTLTGLAGPFGVDVRLLTGSTKTKARREILTAIRSGFCPLVVGTHALFQPDVAFHDLGLVVVDEQHRFGVLQRLALWEKGVDPGRGNTTPHVLVMSATPIPRSLALSRYGDLDLSIIRERPAGRGKIVTRVTEESKRDAVYGYLAERLREGRQAYIIYPLVEESEKSELRAATTMAKQLARNPELEDHVVALLHGQMKPEEKDRVMRSFRDGEVGVLVATTVIEVGIDVPNASFLVIEHPERYGLSQLHQLRGRIGRGRHTSYCVLVAGLDLDAETRTRLEQFAAIDDGFELARLDLQLRGQGDVAGTRQSGRPAYKLADPLRDETMLLEVRARAREALDAGAFDGQLGPEWEPLRRKLKRHLEEAGALTDVG